MIRGFESHLPPNNDLYTGEVAERLGNSETLVDGTNTSNQKRKDQSEKVKSERLRLKASMIKDYESTIKALLNPLLNFVEMIICP